MAELLGKQCSCINYSAKQALEWALDYHIVTVARELRAKELLLKEAQAEFKEITGREPGEYGAEAQIQRLKKEHDFYLELRKEIIETPRCPEPTFGVQNPGRLTVPEQHQLKIAKDTLRMPDAMAGVMGGPTKEEAREIIKRLESKK